MLKRKNLSFLSEWNTVLVLVSFLQGNFFLPFLISKIFMSFFTQDFFIPFTQKKIISFLLSGYHIICTYTNRFRFDFFSFQRFDDERSGKSIRTLWRWFTNKESSVFQAFGLGSIGVAADWTSIRTNYCMHQLFRINFRCFLIITNIEEII